MYNQCAFTKYHYIEVLKLKDAREKQLDYNASIINPKDQYCMSKILYIENSHTLIK